MKKYFSKAIMKYCIFGSIFAMLFLGLVPFNRVLAAVDDAHPGFRVNGRFLYDNTGEKVILYGINKMVIWMDKDGEPSYSEIAKTGANCVRIVWGIDGSADELDTAIRNCRADHMIPIIELHDATGELSKLPTLINYWIKPDVVNVIKKHQQYLLINIGNEVGNANVTATEFKEAYEKSVKQMREVGIHVPLVIDAPSWGQDINMLQSCGEYLTSIDPDKNLMYSVHMWWPYMYGHTDQQVIDELNESANMNLPLVVGEFGHRWDMTDAGKIPYKLIMEYCYKNQIGYLPWEWGPGNNPQTFLDMTSDSTFATLNDWGLDVTVKDKYCIQNIAQRPASMLTNLPPALPQEPLPAGNLALNKPAVASTLESAPYGASNVTDGDLGTRWASTATDPNWVYVDLGEKKDIDRVIINWEAAFSSQYKIQVSDDATNWTDIYTTYSGKGKTEDISVTGSGRYVRIYCSQRNNYQWGNSIFEIGIYGPESELSTSISPTVATFDKNIAKQADLIVTLNQKSNILNSITNGTSGLKSGTDYTVSGNTLTIKKEYLAKLPIGTAKFTLDYNNGVDPVFTVAIGDTSPSAYITPGIVEFDKTIGQQEDVIVTMNSSNNKFVGIKNGADSLVSGTDYTISGNVVTIKKTYLAQQEVGMTRLTFDFDNGTDPVLRVNVTETASSTITPASVKFDSKLPADIQVTMTLNGNILTAIKNGSVVLTKGTDYTISENVVTIKKEYISAHFGIINLTFDFSAGIDSKFTIINGVYGDLNGDNLVNSIDCALLKRHISGISKLPDDVLVSADLNQDKVVDATDVTILKQFILKKITSLPITK